MIFQRFAVSIERLKRCISYLDAHDLPSVNDIEKRNSIAGKIISIFGGAQGWQTPEVLVVLRLTTGQSWACFPLSHLP
jgi:hypothetical protein